MITPHHQSGRESGFTIVELTIASTLLAVILLLLSTIFISLVRQERGAVNLRDSMQATRTALNDISSTARQSSAYQVVAPDASGYGQLCLYQASTMVHYFVDTPGGTSPVGLYKANQATTSACTHISYVDTAGTAVAISAANTSPTVFTSWAPTTASVPLLTLRLGMGSVNNYSVIQGASDPNPGACKDTVNETCTISVMETSISLRGAE